MIDREVRLEVPERMDADGKVLTALDEAAVADAARRLLAAGCEAVVIHFLHSYINPAHERRAAEIVRGLWPNAYVTAGHAILSAVASTSGVTAAVNAFGPSRCSTATCGCAMERRPAATTATCW